MTATVALMRCGPLHPRTFEVPAGAVLEADPSGVTWIRGLDGQHLRCVTGGCKRDGGARALRITTIAATVTTGTCDARCLEAEGATCRCSCGGRNHGKEA